MEKLIEKSAATVAVSETGEESDVGGRPDDVGFNEVNMEPENHYDLDTRFSTIHKQKMVPNYGEESDYRQKWAAEDSGSRRREGGQLTFFTAKFQLKTCSTK